MILAALAPLVSHLWQSTLFAAVAGLLTLTLKRNQARVRYWLWIAASYKFLLPFSWLLTIGRQFEWHPAPSTMPPVFSVVTDVVNGPNFLTAFPAAETAYNHVPMLLLVLWAVWVCGFVAVVVGWFREWLRMRALVRAASPLPLGLPIRVVSTSARLEPGVFGIFRPALLLPEGIAARLTQGQLQAILAHELCHVRRRDNLTAAVHMLVEALFWFHPLLWWLGARLIDERERACDEEVLQSGSQAQVYAESILNVCEFYLESPLTCISGVTGSDLKKRIQRIMKEHCGAALSARQKVLLTAAGVVALAVPVVAGALTAPRLRAQSQSQPEHLAFEVASVKPNNSADFRNAQLQFLPGGKLVIRNVPFRMIVATAYNLPFQSPRLTGGPEWEHAAGERYDIEATAEQGAMAPGLSAKEREDKIRLMLQSLLEERFKLNMRRQPKEQPVYALVVAKGGPRLQKAKVQEKDCTEGPSDPQQIECHSIGGGQGRGVHGDAVSIADVALWVQNWTDLPVVDKTGLTDLYYIQTDGWTPMRQSPCVPGGPLPQGGDAGLCDPDRQTLSDVFSKLGLRMESQRAVVDMFVVDHVEQPSPN